MKAKQFSRSAQAQCPNKKKKADAGIALWRTNLKYLRHTECGACSALSQPKTKNQNPASNMHAYNALSFSLLQ
jgi:hypothetical protein